MKHNFTLKQLNASLRTDVNVTVFMHEIAEYYCQMKEQIIHGIIGMDYSMSVE